LERALDFSVQLEMTATGLKLCGYTGLSSTTRAANFRRTSPSRIITNAFPRESVSLFTEPKDISSRLLEFYDNIFATLAAELRRVAVHRPARH
jgi:hypothetical protein